MRRGKYFISGMSALALVLLTHAGPAVAEPTAAQILLRADEARGNLAQHGIEWTVSVTTLREDEAREMTLRVQARGFFALGEVLVPAKSKGQKLLMQGGDMWFYKPGLSRPVAVPKRQKLLGDAVVADIAATNYAQEYDIAGQASGVVDGESCHLFDLKAKTKKSTYEQVRYWISKERLVGVKAEFYSVSGKKLRTVLLRHQHRFQRRPIVSRMTIVDETAGGKVTTVDFSEPVLKAIPFELFEVGRMKGSGEKETPSLR